MRMGMYIAMYIFIIFVFITWHKGIWRILEVSDTPEWVGEIHHHLLRNINVIPNNI